MQQLGKKLVGTGGNVYAATQELFGLKVDEDVFDDLEKTPGIFRCVGCPQWLEVRELSQIDKHCRDCIDEEYDEERDDDEDDELVVELEDEDEDDDE